MNTWQALKKIVRDQFIHPDPAPKLAVGYYVVNTRAKNLVRHEPFTSEEEARAYIDVWRKREQDVAYLDVYTGARKL